MFRVIGDALHCSRKPAAPAGGMPCAAVVRSLHQHGAETVHACPQNVVTACHEPANVFAKNNKVLLLNVFLTLAQFLQCNKP
ncbi:MAG: hypothetical protein WCY08_08725 [Rhodocyclaceae bacterium]